MQTKRDRFERRKNNDIVFINEISHKQKKTTSESSDCFASRNKEIQETAAFCLMKTQNQNLRNCKPKSVTKRASC